MQKAGSVQHRYTPFIIEIGHSIQIGILFKVECFSKSFLDIPSFEKQGIRGGGKSFGRQQVASGLDYRDFPGPAPPANQKRMSRTRSSHSSIVSVYAIDIVVQI